MKANELMIGDWVQYTNIVDDWGYVPQGKVSKLTHHATFDEQKGYRIQIELPDGFQFYNDIEEHFFPIPLTPEILEKNGFKEVDMNDFRLFRDKEYDCKGIRISFTSKGVCLWKGDSIGISCKSSGCCHYGIPAYVHLLQHALRLCGIEKEIVL